MGKMKRFLFLHGEKVAFAVIALVCVWSIFGNLFRDPNVLPMPEGAPYPVDREEVEAAISTVNKHLVSNKVNVELEDVPRVSDEVTRQHKQVNREVKRVDLEWAYYNRPPKPEQIVEPIPPKKQYEDPEARWRTAIGPPGDWKVIVGRDRILVICRTNAGEKPGDGGIRFPEPGSVKLSLWRKRVGEGKEDLSEELLTAFRQRESGKLGVDVKIEEKKPKPSDVGGPGGENPFEEFAPAEEGWKQPPKREKKKEAPEAEKQPTPTNPMQAYYQQLNQQEQKVWQHMLDLAEPVSLGESKWDLLSTDMTKYSQEFFEQTFTEEAIKQILAGGELPRPVEADVPKAGHVDDMPDKPKTRPGPAPLPVPTPIPGPTLPSQPGETAPAFVPGAEDLDAKYPKYKPHYYVFLDKDVDENALYRYRMCTRLKARPLPTSIAEDEKHKGYDLRVENSSITWNATMRAKDGEKEVVVGGLALTASQFGSYHSQEKGKATKYAVGYQPTGFIQIERDAKTLIMRGLRDEQNRLTKAGVEYRTKPCFSLFTYTDLVLTPVTKRIQLVSVSLDPRTKLATASLHVVLVTPEGEEIKTPRAYALTEPEEANSLTWRSWVVVEEVDGKRRPKWEGNTLVRRNLAQYYAQAKRLRPVRIGGRQKKGAKEYDFSTGWGLVDVKRCKFRVYRYKIGEDGERKLVGDKPLIKDGGYYIVIRSMEKEDQYKRILQRKPTPVRTETLEERIEVIWEPELDEYIQKTLAERAAAAKQPDAAPNGDKAKDGDKPEPGTGPAAGPR